MNALIDTIISYLPLQADYTPFVMLVIKIALIGAFALLAHGVARLVFLRALEAFLSRQKSEGNDLMVKNHVFRRLVHIIPALVIYSFASSIVKENAALSSFLGKASMVYMVVMIVLFIDALLSVLLQVYRRYEIAKHFPIQSFIQIFKLLAYFLGIVSVISLVIGQSPIQLIAGLGAMTAVLMLVFKDPILGFVAGLQLSSNRMVSIGDWIEMPKHGVDGDVLEIALTTVKVRNFDNTITTVPTQSLINDSFKNWAGMQKSGGRRIKRSIHIDMSSIGFCDEARLERFSKIEYINDYIARKRDELNEFNETKSADLTALANGRRLTNLGTFRAYVEAYLRHHPNISQDLTFLVRQLKPTELGLPIEIYVFSTEKRWVQYEAIQADIFDHIIAVVPEFDLRVFQSPGGNDFQRWLT